MAKELLTNPTEYNKMAKAANPYGDGELLVEFVKPSVFILNKPINVLMNINGMS